LTTYEIPSKGTRLFDVVGERYHIDEIAALNLNQHNKLEEGMVTETTFEIVPEPDNPFSERGYALSVRKDGAVLGYLPNDTDLEFVRAFHRIAASGLTAVTTGTLWTLKAKDGLKANIRVAIPMSFKDSTLKDQGDAKLTPVAQTYEVPRAYQGEQPKAKKPKGPSAKLEWWTLVALFFLFGVIPVVGPPIALVVLIAGIIAIVGFKLRLKDLQRLSRK
jgi:hypothetical protein